jgi:hypothetical protein
MRNKLTDVHDHLVAELERLGDESLEGEKLVAEIARAHALTGVAGQIVANAGLVLRAQIAKENAIDGLKLPLLLTD